MKILIPIFVVVYLATLVAYFFSETSGNHKRRSINKIILASLFLIPCIVGYIINFKSLDYSLILLIGIVFCFAGDVLLLFSFTKGGISFMTGNILISTYLVIHILTNNVPHIYPIIAVALFLIAGSIFITLAQKKVINLRNMFIPISFYILSVTLHGLLSLSLLAYYHNIHYILFSLGLALYMVSDYFLMTYKFKYPWKKWVLRCNSGTYFVGMLLVALSYFI